MGVLFATSEMFPYAKSGGLADVAYSLPQALRKTEEVYTIMPLYKIINREKFNIVFSGLTFDYWLSGIRHQFDIFWIEDNHYELFVYNPILCDRDGMYHDDFGDFGDNALRFGMFSYAVLEVMIRLKLSIHTIHLNDWQTSLVALLAKQKYGLTQKVVLTIHNLAYQGIFDKSIMNTLELDWAINFKPHILEFFDGVNFLKSGIYYSDYVTTVSPTYAEEIKTKRYGHKLETMLINNQHKLIGLINGIGYDVFDPQTDQNLHVNYSENECELKNENKKALLKDVGLENSEIPLYIFIGRFTNQKGVDLILESLHLLKDFDANYIILGSGEEHYNRVFENLKNRYHNVSITIGYDEAMARRMYASADFLLMPSLFEPCGLNQMIALKYGTLPIVTKTGGLKDTIMDYTDVGTQAPKIGIGVTFEETNSFWFLHAISKSLSLFANKTRLNKIVKHNMSVDFSWKNSAKEYISLYKS